MSVVSINRNSEPIVSYSSPFFDLSNAAMPGDLDELLDWCIYYYLATPLIPAVINKLSTYPITDTIIEAEDQKSKEKWDGLLNKRLNVKYRMFENNLDFFLMGRAYTSIYMPFKRYLKCTKCQTTTPMNGAKWTVAFRRRKKTDKNQLPIFTLECEVCREATVAEIQDQKLNDWSGINIVRYSPRNLKPIRDPLSGKSLYLWEIPDKYKQVIKGGRHPEFIEACPAEVLEAINTDGKVLLSKDNVYEMRRPSASGEECDCGTPIVIHALKWTYYLSLLQKAQEAIAHEKIVPFDILFPANGGNSAAAPSQTIKMGNFASKLESSLQKHRKDPGHKAVLPIPVGTVRLGGDGRALMLASEIDWVSKQIIASMGVPIEFVYGGLTWTGSSITLRMLENSMTGIRDNSETWLQWVVDKVAAAFKLQAPKVRLAELKMADDVQRQSLMLQLEATEKIATSTLLDEFDLDFQKEAEKALRESDTKAKLIINSAVTGARAQGTAAMVQNDFMMRSQVVRNNQSAAAGIDPATGYPTDPNSGVPIDPNTGYPIDPIVGLPMDPATGEYIDPNTGEPMSPEEAQEYMRNSAAQRASEQNTQNVPTEGDQGVPGSAVDNAIYSQQEQQMDSQNVAAQQSGTYAAAPENLKATVTSLAKQLIGADLFTRNAILEQLRARSPALANMAMERMAQLYAGK